MKLKWDTGKALAMLAPWPAGAGVTLESISVHKDYQGQKLGATLLKEICEELDLNSLRCKLHVHATGPLTDSDLIDWYGRSGFALSGPGRRMVREPIITTQSA